MSIIDAARLFAETSLRGFPVMDNQRIVGQLNRSDMLKALIRLSRDIKGKS
jgi:predicted transcriptional regulator